jgi:general secretion pathway protein L
MEGSVSEYLLVRLSKQPGTKVFWWIVDSELESELEEVNSVRQQGELPSWHDVGELAEFAEQRPVFLLLCSADIVLKEITLPAGGQRQIEKMLPYLVEDDLAQDADSLHFTVLSRQDSQVYAAAVDRAWLTNILEQFDEAGMRVDKVLPDVLALPLTSEADMSAVQLGDEWLIRQGRYHGVCIENAWMPLFSQSEWGEGGQGASVIAYSVKPESEKNNFQTWTEQVTDSIAMLLYRGVLENPSTLLSGPFQKSSSWLKSWKVWRKTLVSLLIMLVLLLISQMVEISRMTQEAEKLRNESEHIFKTIFPERRRIPTIGYLKRQMTDEVERVAAGGLNEGALALLTALSETIGDMQEIQLQNIHYDAQREDIRIDVQGKNFESFELTREKLAQRFEVEQGPLNRANSLVSGSYSLKMKTGKSL